MIMIMIGAGLGDFRSRIVTVTGLGTPGSGGRDGDLDAGGTTPGRASLSGRALAGAGRGPESESEPESGLRGAAHWHSRGRAGDRRSPTGQAPPATPTVTVRGRSAAAASASAPGRAAVQP
jgi:hypothetical protein